MSNTGATIQIVSRNRKPSKAACHPETLWAPTPVPTGANCDPTIVPFGAPTGVLEIAAKSSV